MEKEIDNESKEFLKKLGSERATKFLDKMYHFNLYGWEIDEGRQYILNLEKCIGEKVPAYFKKQIEEGFEGDVSNMCDINDNQTHSLLQSKVYNLKKNPKILDNIFSSETFFEKYSSLIHRVFNHISKKKYFPSLEEEMA